MAPALNLFLDFQASTGASEARPRCVLDCVAVKLHDMKAIPSTPPASASRRSVWERPAAFVARHARRRNVLCDDAHRCTSKLALSGSLVSLMFANQVVHAHRWRIESIGSPSDEVINANTEDIQIVW